MKTTDKEPATSGKESLIPTSRDYPFKFIPEVL
jgi:hypothetical protein